MSYIHPIDHSLSKRLHEERRSRTISDFKARSSSLSASTAKTLKASSTSMKPSTPCTPGRKALPDLSVRENFPTTVSLHVFSLSCQRVLVFVLANFQLFAIRFFSIVERALLVGIVDFPDIRQWTAPLLLHSTLSICLFVCHTVCECRACFCLGPLRCLIFFISRLAKRSSLCCSPLYLGL